MSDCLLCFFPSILLLPAVSQAMRFPPKSYNKDLESAEVSLLLWAKLKVNLPYRKGGREASGGPGPVLNLGQPLALGGVLSERAPLALTPTSFPRNGVSENSRTWSLPRRWQRMMMTASLELGAGKGWGEWGLALCLSPLGVLCSGNWPPLPTLSSQTMTYMQGVKGAGSRPPHLTPASLSS